MNGTEKDKFMNTFKLNRLLKVLFTVLSVLFLLSACSSQEGGVSTGPDDVRNAQDLHNTCWQGQFLKLFYKNLGTQTLNVYSKLTSENLLNIVLLGFTIWMAYQILRHVIADS